MALTVLTVICLGLVLTLPPIQPSREREIMNHWAATLGDELWKLGQTITKADEIKKSYTANHVRVEEKDGRQLLQSAVQSVQRMLTRKTDSIRCILDKAESVSVDFDLNQTSSDFTYSSSKYSQVLGKEREEEIPKDFKKNEKHYEQLVLNEDTHFNYVAVNTSHSSVHVPTNIFDMDPIALEAILWSEELDQVFTQNYKSDPALSWQYFCSSSGILRHYPAMAWDEGLADSNTYDCRTRSWYIEAATCSKDVVILLDNSGSMYGYGNYVARYTVRAILETLSNNDFLNIFAYNNDTSPVVECFSLEKLVQATPENIQTFRDAIDALKPNATSNLVQAFDKAFDLLKRYREARECKNSNQGCNQMIMLVTDGVASNLTDVFDAHNRIRTENGTYIPVRVFTYLIGKEVTKVKEIQDIACSNRGFYAHVHSIDEVQQQVLKYINVIARPLVLQEEDHPPTWTHAYIDRNKGKKRDKTDENLISSVAVPAFDSKINRDNSSYTAELLGVAGTDVPLEDIGKLSLPYKLGVNGYSFVVSNNGYLLLHPNLRPWYQIGDNKTLNINYNSVDLVEVEMINDDRASRDFGDDIIKLRDAMVMGREEGSIGNLSIKFHYDNMRRVSIETQDYYYAPIKQTPFSLGIALPQNYGKTWIKVSDQIKRSRYDKKQNITDFFRGDNWKVHPDWVYCKYHYLEGHEQNNSEDELLHFLKKIGEDDWKWSEQYEQEDTENETFDPENNCGRKTLDDDAYYCNEELVQLLVYDAQLTSEPFYLHQFSDGDLELFNMYNTSLRFIATMSGLTRWQYILAEDSNDTKKEFGDYHKYAIDETWYKSAILQHKISPDSFVFSVPFDSGLSPHDEDITVMASLAIFPRDAGLEAPGSVVGYEFSHTKLLEKFRDITTAHQSVDNSCVGCLHSCSHDDRHDCYVIDGSGFVVLSETRNDTGRFFGEVDGGGAIMEDMVNSGIYRKVVVFDLQGVCSHTAEVFSASDVLQTPFSMTKHILSWLLSRVMWLVVEFQLRQLWDACIVFSLPAEGGDDYYEDPYDGLEPTDSSGGGGGGGGGSDKPKIPQASLKKNFNQEEEDFFSSIKEPEPETIIYPCDKTVNLFVLDQKSLLDGDGFRAMSDNNQSRPFYVALIPHTNMLLLVVDAMYPSEFRKYDLYSSQKVTYPGPPCDKVELADLKRRRLEGCYTDHELESKINMCGSSGRVRAARTILGMAVAAISLLMLIQFDYN